MGIITSTGRGEISGIGRNKVVNRSKVRGIEFPAKIRERLSSTAKAIRLAWNNLTRQSDRSSKLKVDQAKGQRKPCSAPSIQDVTS